MILHLFFLFPLSLYAADTPKIVVTLKPLHSVILQLSEEIGFPHPQLLLKQQADPHHFSLKPSEAKMLEEADLVFMANPQVEFFLHSRAKNEPHKYISLFPDTLNALNTTHGWLNPFLFAESLKNKVLPALETSSESAPQTFHLLQQASKKWHEQLVHAGNLQLWTDSDAMETFGQAYGVNIHNLKETFPSPPQTLLCIALTHGRHGKAYALAKQYKLPLKTLDLVGNAIPAGKQHYYEWMDGLVKQIAGCLT